MLAAEEALTGAGPGARGGEVRMGGSAMGRGSGVVLEARDEGTGSGVGSRVMVVEAKVSLGASDGRARLLLSAAWAWEGIKVSGIGSFSRFALVRRLQNQTLICRPDVSL